MLNSKQDMFEDLQNQLENIKTNFEIEQKEARDAYMKEKRDKILEIDQLNTRIQKLEMCLSQSLQDHVD